MRHEELIGEPGSMIRRLDVFGGNWTDMLVKEGFDDADRFERVPCPHRHLA
jgi:hypothetical protein